MESLLGRIHRNFEEKTRRHEARNQKLRLYQRLYNLLKDGIINNDIPEGVSLPPTRQLADTLKLSRSTVIKAYELLRLEGYIESQTGSGHVVKPIQEAPLGVNLEAVDKALYPPLSAKGMSFRQNINLINSTDDKSIAFRPGVPPLDIFPVNQWKNLSNLYWRHIKSSALSYSPSSGIDRLKRNIAHYLNLTRGIKCDHEQIIVVSGSLQSLYLVGSVLLDMGDHIAMENPTFPNVYSIFKGLGAQIHPLKVDEGGLEISGLKDNAAQVKLLHCTPSCHYPTGRRMAMQQRKEILQWASDTKSIIIENDYEHEIHNFEESLPALFSMDTEQRTVYLGTFNRLLHPSIRIGYMVLPPYLLEPVEALLRHSHRFVPPSIQVVLNQFIEKNYLHTHVRQVAAAAEERLHIFEESFAKHFGQRLSLRKSDVPSLHVLVDLPQTQNDNALVKYFAENNIVTHAFSKCFSSAEKEQGLILGYSSVRPPVIRRKLAHMASLYKQFK
jgi:GntR family transcriptional regulator/MocR family aminotransferase